MTCHQSNYTITVPLPLERTDDIGFDSATSITVTFAASSGYTLTENGISCTPSVDPPPTGVTPPSISQSNHTITFYDPNGSSVDYNVEVAYDSASKAMGILDTPTSKITFRPRTNCPG